MTDDPSRPDLVAERDDLRARLAEAEEALRSIRSGDVDAVLVTGSRGEQLFTRGGADRAYRQLIETMSEGAATLSADGVILYSNNRFATMLERPLDQVMGSVLRSYLPPADKQALDATLAQARTAPTRLELNLRTSEGRLVPVYLSAFRLHSEGAKVVFGLVLTDLTEQRRHAEIVVTERLARLILEQAVGAIVVCDEQGRVIRASQSAQGFCDGNPLLRPFVEAFPLRTDASSLFLLAPVLRGETLRNVDVALDRQGQEIALLVNAGPLLRGQQILGCVITMTDITERKRAEERIVHLNLILRSVRDVNQLIVRERDRQHLIEDACRLLVEGRGYGTAIVILTDEAGVPRAWADAGMRDTFQPLAESLRRGVMPPCCQLAQQHEGVYHVTDGAEVCSPCPIWANSASSISSCIQLRHGEATYGYLSVSMDRRLGLDAEEDSLLAEVAGDVAYALHGIARAEAMTQVEGERDRAEAELRQAQKMEAVGRLAGGVAHDFNNILTVINATCSFLEEGLPEPDPLLADVRTIRDAAESAARLTKQLLAFSRRQVLEPQLLALDALVGESEKMLRRLIGEDIAIRVEPEPDLGLVLADPGQIEQVIVNLAVNARDAMPDGGTLTITTGNVEAGEAFVLRHSGGSAGRYVRLAIADTGCGMDAETQARIFEPFFTTKGVGRGTGLGLSTVYGIIKQSGGSIDVDSAPGRGTTFEIYLPRAQSTDRPWQPTDVRGPFRGRGETVLLVEDESDLRRALARGLRKQGYQVFHATGLAEARRIAATESPIHLLLTDVVMPGGSGRDVSTAVLAAQPSVKVLYMSGFDDDAIVHRGVLDNGIAFLHKPFTLEALGRKLREVLDG